MSARSQVVDFWDGFTRRWLAGDDSLPEPLDSWWASYKGKRRGEPTQAAFAEPYVGPWAGAPMLVMLGLNPGPPDFAFQARDGFFAKQIRESSYREWAESDPYGSELWETRNTVNPSRRSGRKTNIYRAARLRFARDWLDDQTIDNRDLLTVELYPWHSWQVSGTIRPPDAVLDEFVWKPLGEIGVDTAFAFGKPWLDVCQRLGLAQGESWMEGRFHVASRAAVMFRLPHGPQRLVVLWQSGYAGPPGPADTERLRELVGGLGALEAA